MIERHEPSPRDLRVFGLLAGAFFALVGALLRWKLGAGVAPTVLFALALLVPLVYYAIGPLRRPMYLGWMAAVAPLGWLVTHVVLGITFYLVLTPIAFCMRMIGRDAMHRRIDRKSESYWIERGPASPASRYFRQY